MTAIVTTLPRTTSIHGSPETADGLLERVIDLIGTGVVNYADPRFMELQRKDIAMRSGATVARMEQAQGLVA